MDASVRLINGEYVQVVKVLEMPAIEVGAPPAPEGMALEVTQLLVKGDTGDIKTATEAVAALIAGGKLPVSGPVTDTELRATPVPMSLATLPALAAGTNNIGDVDIASIAAGDNNIGNVDLASAIPTGTNTIGATMDAGPAWASSMQHTASANATSGADATAAPTSGQKIVVDDVIVSVDTAMKVTLEEETSGTDFIVLYMAANSVAQVTPRGKIKLATADKKLRVVTSAAGNIALTVNYHSEA